MTNKRKLQIILDMLMLILLTGLMAYSLIDEKVHEWAGMILFVALLLHNYLNLNWHKNLPKGKYNPNRSITTFINLALVILMFNMIISGIAMSKYIFTFLPLNSGSTLARLVHLASAYWFFSLTSFHLGMNWNRFKGMFKKMLKIKKISVQTEKFLQGLVLLVLFFGVYSLYSRGILSYMFLQTKFAYFNFDEPFALFIISYISMMVLFVTLGNYCTEKLQRRAKSKQKKTRK